MGVDCLTPGELHLDAIQLRRIKRFVAVENQDKRHESAIRKKKNFRRRIGYRIRRLKGYNPRNFCYLPLVVNKQGYGLYSIHRGASSHEGKSYFIRGQQRITPLFFYNIWLGLKDEDLVENPIVHERAKMVFDKAFFRHSGELSDSLQQRIRYYFELSKN